MPRVVVFLAEGFEEVEAVTPVNYLRRAGAEVVVAGVGSRTVCGARGISIQTDVHIDDLSGDFAAAVLPGGLPGAINLASSEKVKTLCRKLADSGRVVAAICAAPAVALEVFGLLDRRRFTCYPGCEVDVRNGIFVEDRVVTDQNIITSRGAGTSGEFALAIIAALFDSQTAQQVGQSVLIK